MLAAFATLLVELHLTGCFWGDCSLSNVLYLFDAAAIQTLMVDAETAKMYAELSAGQRQEDLEIMKVNVAGGMADIAASLGQEVEYEDLTLGEAIEERYHELWGHVTAEFLISADERWRITERVRDLNDLGFNVEQIDLEAVDNGDRLRIETVVAGRSYHTGRLRDLTGVEASEGQATQILTDLHHFTADAAPSPQGKALGAIRWRVEVFEPMLARMRTEVPDANPVQAFSDYLHFRYLASRDAGYDIDNDTALAAWLDAGRPGYPIEEGFVIN
ncbi:MAG TPA: DUF4032 domain-containing protein [Actinobacteria bacterium]|nr:DUF4032 domain-containing protein [Actinomycetota bacterium]